MALTVMPTSIKTSISLFLMAAAAYGQGAMFFGGNVAASSSQVATPTDSPGAGTYGSTQSVTLSDSTSGATICYTTDGSTPGAATPGTCDSSPTQTYSGAISVSVTTTIKAIGTKSALTNSGVLTSTYTISIPISQVSTAHTASASSTTPATTTGFDTSTATLLVVTVANSGVDSCTATTVTDSNSNTWNHLTNQTAGNGVTQCIWYSYNKSGGALVVGASHTVTVTGNFPSVVFTAWANTATGATNPYDSTAGNPGATNTSSSTLQPGSLTPTNGNSLIVGATYAAGILSLTCSPLSLNGQSAATLYEAACTEIQTTITAVNPTFNFGQTSSNNIASQAAFHQ